MDLFARTTHFGVTISIFDPQPHLALYRLSLDSCSRRRLARPLPATLDLILADFKSAAAPQHRQARVAGWSQGSPFVLFFFCFFGSMRRGPLLLHPAGGTEPSVQIDGGLAWVPGLVGSGIAAPGNSFSRPSQQLSHASTWGTCQSAVHGCCLWFVIGVA